MQFQVPQNIAMEDRIVGPLTLIQFVIVVVGGGIAFFCLNLTGLPGWMSRGLGGFFALITVLVAMGKFNDQPLYRFFRFILAFLFTPKTRVWHKGGSEVNLIRPSQHTLANQTKHVTKRFSKSDLARLAVVLDSRGREGVIPPQAQPQQKPKS
jgi:hypothetical protein